MKILYHHRTLGDGAEGIHIAALVDAFCALGHEVKVASMIGGQTNITTQRTRFLELVKRKLPRSLYEVMELGYSVVGHCMLMAAIREWKPDLIYERYTLFNMAGIVTARRSGIPIILEMNAPLAYERVQYERLSLPRMARASERFICAQASRVVVVSTPLKAYLVDQGVPTSQIMVLPNGADPNMFKPDAVARVAIREQFGIPIDATVAGLVGILRPWHGIELLLEAVAGIAEQRGNLRVFIVGDGPSRSDLQQLVHARGLQKIVTFTGRIRHAEIPQYLASFDIGISPRATFYASPMKVSEYMATGIAVIAPRMPNLQDLIEDGVDGILFEPENVSELANALIILAADPARRLRLAQRARLSVLAGRTWLHNAARILCLADELAGAPVQLSKSVVPFL